MGLEFIDSYSRFQCECEIEKLILSQDIQQ